VKIFCRYCGMLVGFLANKAAADVQYARGCPVCKKHNTPMSTQAGYDAAVATTGKWQDENGKKLV